MPLNFSYLLRVMSLCSKRNRLSFVMWLDKSFFLKTVAIFHGMFCLHNIEYHYPYIFLQANYKEILFLKIEIDFQSFHGYEKCLLNAWNYKQNIKKPVRKENHPKFLTWKYFDKYLFIYLMYIKLNRPLLFT